MKYQWILLLIVILICFSCLVYLFGHKASLNAHHISAESNLPNRIVSLAPNLTEILFALGLGEKIVAVSSDSDYPPEAAEKSKVGTFWQPNTEAIIAAKPDLVVTLLFEQQKSVADSLNRLGYRVLTLKIEKIGELLDVIRKIGTATGSEQRADELVKSMREQFDDLQPKLYSKNKVKVLWVVQPEPLRVAGRNTFINELIGRVGGENAIGDTIQQYPPIGTEELLACGAEVIIQSAMGSDNLSQQQQTAEVFWDKFTNLPAVRNKRIYVIQSDTVIRLGPRLPEGAELIKRYLYAKQ